tara:strand:+ start:4972 stop:8154 length:3183 start_codon:yes stop_codon:yes gene_type:complete
MSFNTAYGIPEEKEDVTGENVNQLPLPAEKGAGTEVRPGIFFDPNIPVDKQSDASKFFFGDIERRFRTTKPDDLEASSKFRQKQRNKDQAVYADRITEGIKNSSDYNGEDIIVSDFSSDALGIGPAPETETSRLFSKSFKKSQFKLGFADTGEEMTNVLNSAFGKGNYKIFLDEKRSGIRETLLFPRAYVSVKREDGTFTPYSSLTKTVTDGVMRNLGDIAYEIPTSAASIAVATTAAAAVASLGTAGLLVGAPVVLGYFLYTLGKGKEKGREYLKEILGVKVSEEDITATDAFLQSTYEILNPSAGTEKEITSGLLEMIIGAPTQIKNVMKIGTNNIVKGVVQKQATKVASDDNSIYKSAIQSSNFIKSVKEDPALKVVTSDGSPLELKSLILTQITDNKIISRLGSLAEQTTVVIPSNIKKQMQSAVQYLTAYRDKVGQGNFSKFRNSLTAIADYYKSSRNKLNQLSDKRLGTSIDDLDTVFTKLRAIEAKGLYNNVFDKLQNSSYKLEELQTLLPANFKSLIPTRTTVDDKVVIDFDILSQKGANQLDRLNNALFSMTKETTVDGGTLHRQTIQAAVNAMKKANPDFNFDFKGALEAQNPAQILQMFATRYGELANRVFIDPAQKDLKNQANAMRTAILNLIGRPTKPVKGISAELKAANSFSNETHKLTDQLIQSQLKATRGGRFGEIGDISQKIVQPSGKMTTTMENIAQQQKYVMNTLNNMSEQEKKNILRITNSLGTRNLKQRDLAAALKLGNAIELNFQRTIADVLDEGSLTKFDAYFDKFDPEGLAAVGLTKGKIAKMREDAEAILRVSKGGFAEKAGKDLVDLTPFKRVFRDLVEDPVNVTTNLDKLLKTVAKDPGGVQNLRKGLLSYIISNDSGVLKSVTKQSAYGDVGTSEINITRFRQLVDYLKETPLVNKILNEKDIKMLDGMSTYASIVQTSGADAGAALAGAQIVGNLFTLSPAKFISGLARLSAQRRISELFVNENAIKVFTGISDKGMMTLKDRITTTFSPLAIAGQVVIDVVKRDSRDANQQTQDMLQKEKSSFDKAYGIN